jgi:hypothetical protein
MVLAMSSVSSVNAIPSTPLVIPVTPVKPVAARPIAPTSQVAEGGGTSPKPQAANPPGVGKLLDIKA